MIRAFLLTLLSVLALTGFSLVPKQTVDSLTPAQFGAALAQKLPNDGGPMVDPTMEIRMKKSRTQGPGMKALAADAAQYCIDCHKGHDRANARRTRRAAR
jgi:hypothetical protein